VPEHERIRAEHGAIVALVTELGETRDLARMAGVVDKLLEILPGHFAREERSDGLFEELQLAQPAVGSQIEALSQDHRRIEEAVAAMRDELRSVTQALDHVEETKVALAEMLATHERAENLLILEIFLTDEGGSA
jgi:hypothetical protein